jgi:hypothetical protein
MTGETQEPNANSLLSRLDERERDRLGEAMRRLLAHGSILGLEPSQTDLYPWCYQNRDWIDELAGLLDLRLHWDHQDRSVQAVPQTSAFLLRLRLDATLVLLTLWYEFDTAVRDRGETPPVRLTVQQLNDALTAKFEPLRKHMPSVSRLREILALAQRKNLVRVMPEAGFERSVIEVLPTLKRVIPFQNFGEWTQHAERYLLAGKDSAEIPAANGADDEDASGDEA